jgi:hypothetical protein
MNKTVIFPGQTIAYFDVQTTTTTKLKSLLKRQVLYEIYNKNKITKPNSEYKPYPLGYDSYTNR